MEEVKEEKNLKKKKIIYYSIILVAIGLAILLTILSKPQLAVDEKTARCIGENSIIYTQLGCHACEAQEDLFGENYKYLNVIDCFYELDKCMNITATPTWIIDENKYKGLRNIEELKELTGC